MLHKTQKAFTILELVFVIVMIGVLSAIAVPKFKNTADVAYISKASSELASARSALATERQKRILRGDTAAITSLGNVFTNFSAAADLSTPEVLRFSPTPCSGVSAKGCWKMGGAGTVADPATYTYIFPDSGDAKFKLNAQSRLVCDNDGIDCKKLGD